MTMKHFVGWKFSNYSLGTGAKIIVADDGRNIGVMYSPNVNPLADRDAALAVAAPKLQTALAELVAALDEALAAVDVAGSVWAERVNIARAAADAALAEASVAESAR